MQFQLKEALLILYLTVCHSAMLSRLKIPKRNTARPYYSDNFVVYYGTLIFGQQDKLPYGPYI